ncbi:hypothetical protein XM38_018860 [Halomicronema hongdechloris C2206]|uniref:Lipoprotein n=2 Tax=Halomicronema hongdechloris TaxID=1209493 RepID=A0A1Z3HKW2_9CYAN|nr:hypothetical protein XM38_018860 [Halomicronema hongdechloris C2206]
MGNVLIRIQVRATVPVLLLLLAVGCRPRPQPMESVPTDLVEPTLKLPTPTSQPTPDDATALPSPSPTPTTAARPTSPATPPGSAATTTQAAQLPQALTKTWQPQSNVLLTFGALTITANEVRWDSGQASPYEVVASDGNGYLLKLTQAPSFYDTPHPYIRLRLQPDDGASEMEVVFYESEQDARQDAMLMLGSYFAP